MTVKEDGVETCIQFRGAAYIWTIGGVEGYGISKENI